MYLTLLTQTFINRNNPHQQKQINILQNETC